MTSNRFSPAGVIIFPVLLLIIFSSGCSDKKQIRGKNIVSQEVMVKMMVDMHLIDGLTNDVKYYRKYNPNDSIDLYGSVFEEYEVKKEDFYNTMQEYASIPNLLDELYREILLELNLMQEELNKAKQDELDNRKKIVNKELVSPEVKKKSIRRNIPES